MIKVYENELNAKDFCLLTAAVGWGSPPEEQVQKALINSIYKVTIKDNERIIGMGRLSGDGALFYYVKDVVVLPEYQKKGIGKMVMDSLINYIKANTPAEYKVSVELMSAKGKEGFYEKFGFIARPNEHRGPGMFMFPDKDGC